MPRHSAGLILYRRGNDALEVFLVHPGGPYWAKKDLGAWSIPKGEYAGGEDPLQAAQREFHEETGFDVRGRFIELGEIRQPGGKIVSAWALEGNCNPEELISNRRPIEWPPHSGRQIEIPEVDRGAWFSLQEAQVKSPENGQSIFPAGLGFVHPSSASCFLVYPLRDSMVSVSSSLK
jgi:predicted NUDIX family NTP pyrophosphohydrolase